MGSTGSFAGVMILKRFITTSGECLKLKFPAYNPHKKATDPKKQDFDYYEKAASDVPLDDHYTDKLKMLYEDKIAYEKDLRYKAEDQLVGRSPAEYLPKIDLTAPKVGYENIDALVKAPDSVKKIFSIEYGSRRNLSEAWKNALIDQVRKHSLDKSSLEMKIGWLTGLIRHWTLLVEEIDNKPRKPTKLLHQIKLAIDFRRKLLRYLRENDSAAFEKVLADLKIAYCVPKYPEETVEKRRKAWVEAQLTKRVEEEKENRLSKLYMSFAENIDAFDKEVESKLEGLKQEKEKLEKRLAEIDAIQNGFVARDIPKYYPHVVGNLSLLTQHMSLFYHPCPVANS